jgi:lipopolysaccharide biosynthesis glycosyltransferase
VSHLSVALYSLLVNNPNDKFCISVFTDDFSDESERKIKKLVRSFNSKFEVVKLKSEVFNNLTFTFHFAPVNYFRLHIHKYYTDDVILYLDVDIIINGSISDLFNYSVDNYYLAAVPELTFDRFDSLNMKSSSSYFNAGVMLINNKKWREDNFGDKVLEYILENKSVIMMADQDGLNSIIDGDFLKLPAKYLSLIHISEPTRR